MRIVILILTGLFTAQLSFAAVDEALKKEVLDMEPSFKSVVDKKIRIDNEIEDITKKLQLKESEYKKATQKLKDDINALKAKSKARVDDLQKSIEPERAEIITRIKTLERQIKEKSRLYNDFKKTESSIEKMIRDNDEAKEIKEDKSEWYARLNSLHKKMLPLQSEIASLKHQLKLEKKKLNLISGFSSRNILKPIEDFFKDMMTFEKKEKNEN